MSFAVVIGCSLHRCRGNVHSDTGRREEAKYLVKLESFVSLFMIVFRNFLFHYVDGFQDQKSVVGNCMTL